MKCLLLAAVAAVAFEPVANASRATPDNGQDQGQPEDQGQGGDQDQGGGDRPNQGENGPRNGNSQGSDQNARAAAAGGGNEQGEAVKTIGPIQDAELRTFAGPCLVTPRGGDQQAALVGSLAGLIPAFVGTGIDILTAALEEAGKDQVTTVQTTLALEHRPYCIQVARMGRPTTSELMDPKLTPAQSARWLQDSLKQAPFLVEFYLRQSRDGTAVAVMPTVIRYNQNVTGKIVSRTPRELFATLTFSTVGSADSSKVSVPLGSYAPQTNANPHYFDPVVFPRDPTLPVPTGAASSQWFKSPYSAPAELSAGDAKLNPDGTVAANSQNPPATGQGQIQNRDQVQGQGYSESDDAPPSPPSGNQGQNNRNPNPAAAPQPPLQAKTILYGDRTKPYSILVELKEVRPGSSFARILASFLKSGKQTIVDATDPAKQAAAKKTDLDNWKTAQTNYATALADYYEKRAAYCLAPSGGTAAKLLESQVKLAAAAKVADDAAVPFNGFIDPIHPVFSCS